MLLPYSVDHEIYSRLFPVVMTHLRRKLGFTNQCFQVNSNQTKPSQPSPKVNLAKSPTNLKYKIGYKYAILVDIQRFQ